VVGNVFAFRTPYVHELELMNDPVGPDNQIHQQHIIHDADVIVVCWGNRDKVPNSLHHHIDTLLSVLEVSGKPVMCLKKNKSGDPGHPLFLSASAPLTPFFT
jgi:hypothetical protein